MSAWFRGDALWLEFPADAQTLREAGAAFLTRAFQLSGVLAADNAVREITQCQECAGGSTGRKLLLAVRYARPEPGLHEALFVKFSRDFDDPVRDQGRSQMAAEVRLAQLSRAPAFPIAVPVCHFADFHRASGSGILITQRIAFGAQGIEPQYQKCLDEQLPEPLAHYRAILIALARLAGTQQSGQLPARVNRDFAFDPARLSVGERAPYGAAQLQRRVDRYAQFAQDCPQLLAGNIRAPAFIARLREEVAQFAAAEGAIKTALQADAPAIALCHWNANIDNAWFWREHGALHCGLMDWGCVGRMHLAMALWGALSAAPPAFWDAHEDELLETFVDEYARSGGARLAPAALRQPLYLYAAFMGMNWLLDAPAYLKTLLPELGALQGPQDARLLRQEAPRTQLRMLSTLLHLWQSRDFGAVLGAFQRGARPQQH